MVGSREGTELVGSKVGSHVICSLRMSRISYCPIDSSSLARNSDTNLIAKTKVSQLRV